MSERAPFPPGKVIWSGENPGMYLKESENGPFTGLASFFRVVYSPHGKGVGVVLLEAPDAAQSTDDALNVCLTDNETLARWLVAHFVSSFGAFRGKPGLEAMEYRSLYSAMTENDLPRTHREQLTGSGLEVELTWSGLSEPYMVAMPVDKSATGRHEMFSLFVDAGEAVATINGRHLRGRSMGRDFAGRRATTAFLAFSETWVEPQG